MQKIIGDLKQDHSSFISTLKQIRELGISSNESKLLLSRLKSDIISHLDKEDIYLYPSLRKEATMNKSLQKTLDYFAKEMENVTKEVMSFFKKYENGGSGIEFAEDFGRINALISNRMKKEESILYIEFEKLEKN